MTSGPKVHHYFFPAFDAIRGVSILCVILGHTPIIGAAFEPLRPLGALGVHMFFALSGFLITHRLLEEAEQTGRVSLRDFYLRRARRILPPALIYLVVLAIAGPLLRWLPTSRSEIAACLFLCRNWFQPAMPAAWYTGHFWSLSVEEQFYLIWPAILVALGPTRWRSRAGAGVMILAAIVWRAHVTSQGGAVNVYRTDLLADHLLWGCLLALSWTWIQAHLPRPVRAALGGLGLAATVTLLYLRPPYWQPCFAFAIAIGVIFAADAAEAWASRVGPLLRLGQASYDCYIWQSLFLPLPFAGQALPVWQRLPLCYFAIAAVTAASYRLTFPGGQQRSQLRLG